MKNNIIREMINKFNSITVNSDWLKNGQEDLRNFMRQNPVRNYDPVRHSRQSGFFNQLILKPMPIAIIALISSLLAGGGAVTASQNSLPTDLLYPVKRIVENVQVAVTSDNAQKIVLQTDLATKRLSEIKELQKRGRATKEVVNENLKSYEKNLNQAQTYLIALNSTESELTTNNMELSKNTAPSPTSQSSGQVAETNNKYVSPKVITAAVNLEAAVASQQAVLSTLTTQASTEYKTSLADSQKIATEETTQTLEKVGVISRQDLSSITPITKTIIDGGSSAPTKIMINESIAIKIAQRAGLKKGIKPWKTSLHWYSGKVNNYVWTVSASFSEYSGQTAVIDASSGKVYSLDNYQIMVTPPVPNTKIPTTSPAPTVTSVPTTPAEPIVTPVITMPTKCPEWINCMPSPDRREPCQVPVGCDGITQIAY